MVTTRRLEKLRTDLEGLFDLPSPPFVVALSGGADSATLAALTNPTRAVHVHHGRPHSDQMEEAAVAIARVLGIPLGVERTVVEPWSEGVARDARYALLLANLKKDETLLTGHTADDQAETVLANIIRGAGPQGFAGIPQGRGRIFRPLLRITRSQTREFATLANLPWRDDPSNSDLDPLRNRIRHRLLPLLESEYNPGIRLGLQSLGEIAQSAPVLGEPTEDGWRIPASVLWAAGPAAGAQAIREALRPFRGGYGLDRAEVRRVWEIVVGEHKATELQGGLRVERDGSWLVFRSLPLPLSENG
jgi:tRNA(Ile)-lysidine synthase